MAWINGLERKRFNEEQKRLAEQYRAAGMTEEQIEQMYQFDLVEFNSRRRFSEHTQQFSENAIGRTDQQPVPYALPLPKTARRGVGRQGVSLFACREISGVLCCRRRYRTDPPHFVRQKKLSKRPGRSNVIKLPQGHTGMPLRFCYFSAS